MNKKVILGKRNFVIFGTGELGSLFYNRFKNKDNILFFVDNNEHYKDEIYCEKKIYKYAKEILFKSNVDFIVICAVSALDVIYNQLKNDGIDIKKVLIANANNEICLYGISNDDNEFLELFEIASINSLFIRNDSSEECSSSENILDIIGEIKTLEIINSQKENFYE